MSVPMVLNCNLWVSQMFGNLWERFFFFRVFTGNLCTALSPGSLGTQMAPTGMQRKGSKSNKRPLYLVTCCKQCNVMKPRFSSVTVAFLRRKLVIEAERLKHSTAQAILSLYPCGHDNFKGQACM